MVCGYTRAEGVVWAGEPREIHFGSSTSFCGDWQSMKLRFGPHEINLKHERDLSPHSRYY